MTRERSKRRLGLRAVWSDAELTSMASRLTELERVSAHMADESAVLRARLATIGATKGMATGGGDVPARSTLTLKPTDAGHMSSRRRLLGLGAKAAVATVAAGVLAEQVGTRAAFASPGTFTSNVSGTPAVSAQGTNGADGIDASSDSSSGIFATSTSGDAVVGISTSRIGVYGESDSVGAVSVGVYGNNKSNASGSVAILGHSDNGLTGLGPGTGVLGETANGVGVAGTATSGWGMTASSTSGTGLSATSGSGVGVYGRTSGSGPTIAGVYGTNTSNNPGSVAVWGFSDNGSGGPGPGYGVFGQAGAGSGVVGLAATGTGVNAQSGSGVGVYGTTAGGASTQAIHGVGTSGSAGLRASSDSGNGIVATSTNGTGLNVQSGSGSAVIATSSGVGYGLYLTAPSGWAIGCVGRIRVLGAAVGTATLTHGTTSKTVSSSACSGSSQVILTPTSNPQVSIWAVAAPGSFTIHASAAPNSDVTFSYLLIN